MTAAAVAATPVWQAGTTLVIDTNIVLDLWVFDDPQAEALREALRRGVCRWIATAAMREELARVLAYPAVSRRARQDSAAVLATFDALAVPQPSAPRAPCVCADRDDQVFIDLAVAHRAVLLSKDRAVRRLARRLQPLGVRVGLPGP